MVAELEINVLQTLQQKLDTLKKNRESVPEDTLKTKYAKAYNALLEDIKKLKLTMITEALSGIRIASNKAKDAESHWKQTQKNINRALYEEYNVNKAQEILESFIADVFIEYNSVKIYQLED